MVFKQFVGQKIVWSGEFPDKDTDEIIEYVMFEDGRVVRMNGDGVDDKPIPLDHGIDVLREHLHTAEPWARNVIALVDLLAKAPAAVDPAVKAILDKKLPAADEIAALQALDDEEAADMNKEVSLGKYGPALTPVVATAPQTVEPAPVIEAAAPESAP